MQFQAESWEFPQWRKIVMVTLGAILEEAKGDPFYANSTVLDTDQFHTIRGPSSPKFRTRLEAALAGPDDLAETRQLNCNEGLEVIEPVQAGIRGGYWYLRSLTRVDEMFPAGESHYQSIVEALQAAIEWWQAETWCRSVIVRKYNINRANGSATAP
jgi:hypothetical protein